MNLEKIRQHKEGFLYAVKKEATTLRVPYIATSMEAVLKAYKEMWGREPHTIELAAEFEHVKATVVSAD
jgi:hypothetical protein